MKTLLQTDSIQELAEFWEIHDLTEFENELEEVTEPIFTHDAIMEIHLSPDEVKTVKEIACLQDISVTDLLHHWIMEQIHLITKV